jgi:hypothetical protein
VRVQGEHYGKEYQQSRVSCTMCFVHKLQRAVNFAGRVTPVPIPNTEVKPAGADGTARVTAWESRKSPGFLHF